MKSLSSKPNIEFLKNTAKSLRFLHQKGDPASMAKFYVLS